MNKRSRFALLATAGALLAFGGTLTPTAHSIVLPSAAAGPRATTVDVFVDSIKITSLAGHFQADGRIYVTASGNWSLDLWADQFDNCRFAPGNPLTTKMPPGGDYDYTGGPTTAHEIPISLQGRLTNDILQSGTFLMHGKLRQGAEDSETGTVPSVLESFETFNVTPQAMIKNGDGTWKMDVRVEFKVNTNKSTLDSDVIVQRSRASDGDPAVTGTLGIPGGTTYFNHVYELSGTYVFPEPDPVEDPQKLLWAIYVNNPNPASHWIGGLKHISNLEFN